MSVDQVLTRGRALAESIMTDTCTITRAGTGKGPFNEATGKRDAPDRVTVYTGKCRIQVKSAIAASSAVEAGGRVAGVQEFEWQGPIADTEDITTNDLIHMDTAAHDTALTGREFTVIARHEKTHATARRLRVAEVTK